MSDVGTVFVDVKPDTRTFGRDLSRDMSRSRSRFASVGRGIGSSLVGGMIGIAAGAGIVKLLGDSVTAASDLGESLNKVNVVFGKSAKTIRDWAENSATDFGLSEEAAYAAAGTFGNMFTQLDIGTNRASQMSRQMIELSADFASFHNADISEVIEAQTAAFRGEYDSLQKFVPTINAANVQQRAMRMGLAESTGELTAQDKALATHKLMLEGAGKATGDFDRTNDGMANVTRTLRAQFEDLLARVGQKLLPMFRDFAAWVRDNMPQITDAIVSFVQDAVHWVRHELIPGLRSMKDWWDENGPAIVKAVRDTFTFIVEFGGWVIDMFKTVGRSIRDLADMSQQNAYRMVGYMAFWAEQTLRFADKAQSWMPGYNGRWARTADVVRDMRIKINDEINEIQTKREFRLALHHAEFDQGLADARARFNDAVEAWKNEEIKIPIDVLIANISGDGAGMPTGRGASVAAAQAAASGLPVRMTNAYRSPAENAAAGGSPTSYHMDRSNPASDWVGPGWALDIMHQRLQRSPVRRELLWRTAGHYDHLHFAEKGLVATRPTLTLMGENSRARRGGGEIATPAGLMADVMRQELQAHDGGTKVVNQNFYPREVNYQDAFAAAAWAMA